MLALFLVRQPAWRRWYLLAAIGNAALTVLVMILQLELVDLAETGGGLSGDRRRRCWSPSHVGWFREQERENDMVSFGLFSAACFVAVPLSWAVLYCRFSR